MPLLRISSTTLRTRVFPFAVLVATGALVAAVVWSVARVFLSPDDAVVIQVVPIADDHLQVQVEGAVRKPGVYALPAGSTVSDAVELAGGFAAGASLSSAELSALLTDGHFIHVPSSSTDSGSSDQPIDINSATMSQLESLPGIGPVIAGRIVAYRDAVGGFSDVSQLAEVAGVSERMVGELDGLIVVSQE